MSFSKSGTAIGEGRRLAVIRNGRKLYAFEAKFAGKCALCGERFLRRAMVLHIETGGVTHVRCGAD